MIIFYTDQIQNEVAILEGDEFTHCIKTLRKQLGDQVHFVDGNGNRYRGQLIEIRKKNCAIGIQNTEYEAQRAPFQLHIAIAPTKNINRLEWFLEKCTEIGIDEITPILCKHSERKNIRLDRLEKILIAAMKQSLKSHLPKLHPLTPFSTFVESISAANAQKSYIAHCHNTERDPLNLLLDFKANHLAPITVLIGPEGDFSEEEVQFANQHHFKSVSLGKERLRTETAGIVACHTVNLLAAI